MFIINNYLSPLCDRCKNLETFNKNLSVTSKTGNNMSTLSLSRICSGRKRKEKLSDMKTGSSSTLPLQKNNSRPSSIVIDINNNNAPQVPMRQKVLNRRGSLFHNQFKGVKKELFEKHANLIVHTLTVSRTKCVKFS